MAMATPPPLVLVLVLAFPSHPRALGLDLPSVPVAASSSSPFDAALAMLQKQIAYNFSAPDLLRRAMTHASYSRENGRALAVLGLAAAQSAAALHALDVDHDAAASVVSRRARVGIPAIVRVAAGTNASVAPVVCGALRALIGAVSVAAGSADAAGELFWRLHVLTAAAASTTAAI